MKRWIQRPTMWLATACGIVWFAGFGAPVRAQERVRMHSQMPETRDAVQEAIAEIPELRGERDPKKLESRVASLTATQGGAALARQLLQATVDRPIPAIDFGAIRGLRAQRSNEALAVLKDAVGDRRSFVSRSSAEALGRAWAHIWTELNGRNFNLAISTAGETSRDPVERSLYLSTLRAVGTADGPERALAVDAHRPYLNDPHPELRLAACRVNRALWDESALPILQRRAFEDPDPRMRSCAYNTTARYLRYGKDRPFPGQGKQFRDSHPHAHDSRGYAEWRLRRGEWNRELQALLLETGEPGWEVRRTLTRGDARFHEVVVD